MTTPTDPFETRTVLKTSSGKYQMHSLPRFHLPGGAPLERLPVTIRVLLEGALRHFDNYKVTEHHIRALGTWGSGNADSEIPFLPARVLLQDFTGVPAVVDLAAMRSAIARMGGDPQRINPCVPVDLVIDHSVQVDYFGSSGALKLNVDLEFARNRERYEFLHWGQQAFRDFRVIPPDTGIVHQVNLEYLAKVAMARETNGALEVFPDTLVGTDSHTTMINGLGVVGWGVGGIEAEAVILGQPIYMLMPDVVGFRLRGRLAAGATATDLVLRVTEILRQEGVVGKFVEFCGDGLSAMSLPDRATIANMAPEYGATMGFFPVDDETLRYLARTGRTPQEVDLVERYYKEQLLFHSPSAPEPAYTRTLELDLATVEPSLAGPKRPQDRIPLSYMKQSFVKALRAPIPERGFALTASEAAHTATVTQNGHSFEIGHGSVVIAAITSCTNTSNPSVMVGAGLLARKAVARGLRAQPQVKTSMAPGSRVVTDYLNAAGLTPDLEALGFHTVGYGCTTCIGNSGPLPEPVARAIEEQDLVVCAVLSGNRNFEGRINPHVRANYLASPPLVVAYAIAGRTDIDLTTEPLGTGSDGAPVYLKDIWPTHQEISDCVEQSVAPEMFRRQYGQAVTGNAQWNAIHSTAEAAYDWNPKSTYIQEPPFFRDLPWEPQAVESICGARVLVMVGDSVTTDHISPAGSIPADGPAGRYLMDQGVPPSAFNSFGSRRGNDRVMTRGTFANIRLKNLLAPGTEGGVTVHLPSGTRLSIFEAAERYRSEGTPLLALAGTDYGMGSSRDWAAKGTLLLGIRAVLAASYERIHRSNLIGMGVLPLQFMPGEDHGTLKLSGHEVFDIALSDHLEPRQNIAVTVREAAGRTRTIHARLRIDTPVELDTYRHGGVLPMVLRDMLKDS